MSEHTPGPWNTDHHPGDVWAANGRFIADCHSGIIKEQFEESCANARMIAAAPDSAAERDRLKASNAELVRGLEQIMALEPSPDMPARSQGIAEAQYYARSALSRATETKG